MGRMRRRNIEHFTQNYTPSNDINISLLNFHFENSNLFSDIHYIVSTMTEEEKIFTSLEDP